MPHIYFVRHGQTEWNSVRKLQGELDSPLTKEGKEQAMQLRNAFTHSFDICITSPLGRAVETAEILTKQSKTPTSLEPLLSEMAFGLVEGLEKEEFKAKYPQEFYNLWHHADKYDPTPFEGETFQSVSKRAEAFLKKLHAQAQESKILVVGHGMILKVIFGLLWEHDLEQFWNDPVPLNTSITHVELTEGTFKIVDFSKVSHLTDTEVISYV